MKLRSGRNTGIIQILVAAGRYNGTMSIATMEKLALKIDPNAAKAAGVSKRKVTKRTTINLQEPGPPPAKKRRC